MAKIKTKEIEIFKTNPNGNVAELNTSTRYSIYFTSCKEYVLNIIPCNVIPMGYQHDMFAYINITLVTSPRRNAKTQRTLEEWLKANADALNSAFLARGKDGVKEAVRDLFHVA